MSVRIFLAGAAFGAVVGALVVIVLRPNQAPMRTADDAIGPPSDAAASTTSESPSPAGATIRPAASIPATTMPDAGNVIQDSPVATGGFAATPQDTDADFLRSMFDDWGKSPNAKQLNDKLKSEERDEEWASRMETELQDYFARRPAPNALGSVTVRCGATICRSISIVHEEVITAIPYSDMQAALNELPNESLGRELEFSMTSVGAHPTIPGQMLEVAFMNRARKPADAPPQQ